MKVEAVESHPDPFTNFADFEQSPLQSPSVSREIDNPFRLEEQTDVLVSQLSQLSPDEFSAVLTRVIKRNPSLREVLHSQSRP